ncbi:MAG: NAD(P)/FAD-dependent oxidoreductase [Acidobacteriota bacterium]|nr:NAD(P)/FAD-dependent oxidoreductase [Acidobacteriota bacterium]
MDTYDVIVIGAGFGGLATALTLAEEGARVLLVETLGYPGGCASTYERRGYRFESGATLFSGFGEGQLMERWTRRHGLTVEHRVLDPVVELRAPGWSLSVPPRREELVARLCALPGAPEAGIEAFFDLQRRVADALWGLFSEPRLLPPFGLRELWEHARRLPSYLPLAGLVGRPVGQVLKRYGLESFEPLVTYLDATCQITVQAGVAEAEAPFALAAMDYYFRGTGHVHGGVGRLAESLVQAIRGCGGEVAFFERAEGLTPSAGGWRLRTRRRTVAAGAVVANLLPQALEQLLPDLLGGLTPWRLRQLAQRVEDGWGAAMLYLALPPDSLERSSAHHLELVQDPTRPLLEGNHLFCSVSAADETGRTPDDGRTVTVSTHVPMQALQAGGREHRAVYVEQVQERMRQGLRTLAPELAAAVEHQLTASPRTFERFTGRPEGYVGGIPRRAGLSNYRNLAPRPILPGLFLVGDSVFPGQSTLATALGGVKVAQRVLAREL